ncbi:multiheme c-type cytochrome [Aestuariirhabdus litorea]|uniref:Hydroxylamine oxidoreductase n=1 Tax=Aestuariirhabdus litorea TaxID=2528527 RepID=A0A3P3VN95_9GAMM|nr:multiheme c-type cytochrome [Aestuariirhabdus litorea]RRJ83817.1 hydroxylamine oxidoreductase [Aestuariirhabdus litorea]RWW97040.1 hydroxylamine oxidoreductase [Endozoicomonadaceae bacterium GTF-13]
MNTQRLPLPAVLCTVLAALLFFIASPGMAAPKPMVLKPFKELSKESAECAACHRDKNPSIYAQWGRSKHYGANVGCYECHQADPSDPDAIKHEGQSIAVIVSPKDCATCHESEVDQFAKSHHAKAGQIIGSLDNFLAEVVEGALTLNGESPAAVNGCWQCHGSVVKVMDNGDLDPATWPNTGIGRLNPDGSVGACTACHQRHEFSMVQARRPEACGKCHLGPDHPQKEIYEESKHGINFYANVDRMNLDSAKWIVGEDYDAAPTCATCHMSATREQAVTHDVGDRISWTLRPAISEKIDAKAKAQGKQIKSWQERRKDMAEVCQSCHTKSMVDNFYQQFDSLVNLYNDKFASPGKTLMDTLKKEKMLTDIGFDEEIEWTWFYLWHHEGRRARHGAAMQAPDYVQWHGMFEVAERFYVEMVPQYLETVEKAEHAGNTEGAARARKVLEEILNRPEHAWFSGNEPEEVKKARKEAQDAFKARYLNDAK